MTTPFYATREDVQQAMDSKLTARDNARIDRALEAATRSVEGLCHRRFYPQQGTRSFDWPNGQRAFPWRLWLDDNDLISVTELSSGGVVIPPDEYFLRRADDRDEPPYTFLELNIGTSAAFGGGDTWQRDISITGLWGYSADTAPAGALAADVDATIGTVQVTDSAAAGVGDLLQIGTERLIVTGKSMVSTGQTLQADLTAAAASVTVQVDDGTAFAEGETILLDAERMLITDIAGDTLIVRRAWDGSVLATHTSSTIYAPRTLRVNRGALGTTPAAHTTSTPVLRHLVPGPVRTLAIAEALTTLQGETTGYARTRRTGNGQAERVVSSSGVTDLRSQVYASHGRKARLRGV
ncbi:hypothetical protein [Peterkaempfera sp. SMS 1(5)a]|uniref:hypothetical protein n=1 Tax=Peterkaempfera podocarpi TaxID=3232308 RepID=UPI003670BDB2